MCLCLDLWSFSHWFTCLFCDKTVLFLFLLLCSVSVGLEFNHSSIDFVCLFCFVCLFILLFVLFYLLLTCSVLFYLILLLSHFEKKKYLNPLDQMEGQAETWEGDPWLIYIINILFKWLLSSVWAMKNRKSEISWNISSLWNMHFITLFWMKKMINGELTVFFFYCRS